MYNEARTKTPERNEATKTVPKFPKLNIDTENLSPALPGQDSIVRSNSKVDSIIETPKGESERDNFQSPDSKPDIENSGIQASPTNPRKVNKWAPAADAKGKTKRKDR